MNGSPFTMQRAPIERIGALVSLPVAVFLVLGVGRGMDSPLPWIVLGVIALAALQTLRARIELDPTGVLTLRHVVRTESVDLSRLAGARAEQRYRSRGVGSSRTRRLTRVLELRDADGRTLVVEPARWHHPDLLLDAVRTAAQEARIPLEGGEIFEPVPPGGWPPPL